MIGVVWYFSLVFVLYAAVSNYQSKKKFMALPAGQTAQKGKKGS
jgi:hypothetical protein